MRRLLTALLCLALLCLFPQAAGTDGDSAAVIDRYSAQCIVDANGRAVMTVTVDITLSQPVEQLDFPIGSGADGSIAGLDTKAVKTEEGTLLRLTSEAGISGSRTFVISYTLPQAISETETGQQFSLELIAPGWAYPMTEAAFSVTMPAAFTETPRYTGSYYGDVVEDYLQLQSDSTSFSGQFTEPLRDHDSLQVTLELPDGYADLQSAHGISSLVSLLLVVLLAALCLLYWARTLRNPRLGVRLRPMAPDGSGAGDLPMLLTCAPPSLPLQVMQWAAMGYLTIHVNARGRVVLQKTMEMGTERRPPERAVFAKLFDQRPLCDGEGARFGRLSVRYAQVMESWWNRRLFSRTSGSPALLRLAASLAAGAAALGSASAGLPVGILRGVWLALSLVVGVICGIWIQKGILAAVRRQYRRAVWGLPALLCLLAAGRIWGGLLTVLLAVALQVFASVVTLRGGRRSPGGRDMLVQALGFQRYFRHISPHQLRLQLRNNSQFYYEMLPYAAAMGMGADFSARFGDTRLEPCAWFTGQQHRPGSAPEFFASFQAALAAMEQAARRA